MNAEDFVRAIKVVVCKTDGILTFLKAPPGRRPEPGLLRLAEWIRKLPAEDSELLARIVELTASHTTYAFLLVLDGLLAIEEAGPKGRLELFYDNGITREHLNDPNSDDLTSLFKQID